METPDAISLVDRVVSDYGLVGLVLIALLFYRRPIIEALARQVSDPTVETLKALRAASEAQSNHFAQNNQMFTAIVQLLPALAQEMKAHREATEESLQVLRAMHVELIRSERGK